MALIRWNPRFSVGLSSLDDDHRALAELINALYRIREHGGGAEAARPILDQLTALIVDHFAREEALMETHGYPAYGDHWNHHVETNAALHHHLLDIKAGPGEAEAIRRVHAFLRHWYVSHLRGSDLKLRQFFVAQGLADVHPATLGQALKDRLARLAHRVTPH